MAISASVEERLQIVDEKLQQLGMAALELEEKIDNEVGQAQMELNKQLRIMKILVSILSVGLCVTIAAVVYLLVR